MSIKYLIWEGTHSNGAMATDHGYGYSYEPDSRIWPRTRCIFWAYSIMRAFEFWLYIHICMYNVSMYLHTNVSVCAGNLIEVAPETCQRVCSGSVYVWVCLLSMCVCVCVCVKMIFACLENILARWAWRVRNVQTDHQIERQTDGPRDSPKDKDTDRQTDRLCESKLQIEMLTFKHVLSTWLSYW